MTLLTLLLALNAHADEVAAKKAPAAPAHDERLSQRAIADVISGESTKFKDCYENNTKDEKPSGRLKTRFTIGAEGKVTDAAVLASELKSVPIEACVVSVLKGLSFTAPAGGGTVQVEYPFVFAPAKAPAKKKKK